MKGSKLIIDRLNYHLTIELKSMDVYFIQAKMYQNWGYRKLAERLAHESDDERKHADAILDRILMLDGTPEIGQRAPYAMPNDPVEIIKFDLADEMTVRAGLIESIRLCLQEGDHTTREILEQLLEDTEEDHIRWLETELNRIKDVGRENWLAQQI